MAPVDLSKNIVLPNSRTEHLGEGRVAIYHSDEPLDGVLLGEVRKSERGWTAHEPIIPEPDVGIVMVRMTYEYDSYEGAVAALIERTSRYPQPIKD